MENIGNYLSSCENYGVPKTDLFQTVDLYEGQNMPQVINGIIALGRKVRPDVVFIITDETLCHFGIHHLSCITSLCYYNTVTLLQ